MTTSTTIAVAQFAPGPDTAANLAAIEALAGRAARRGARIVVFPEYSSFFEAAMGPASVAAAQPVDGPFVADLRRIAATLDLHLVAGLVESAAPDPDGAATKFSNTLVAVSPAGGIVATYRKLHLYDAFGQRESDWVVPGALTDPETFEVDGFTVGLQTCYDIRFPEVTRVLVDAGCDIVLVPAEWVRGPLKEHHWRTLVTARALENTIYVAAADHTPPVGVGNSLIVDPHGVTLASLGDEAGLAVAEVTRERLDAVRAQNPALLLRRFHVEPGAPATRP
ncbi:carbon-nitrogen hydrolase family protein [Frondihabitans australicus]|uniref:Putative amidohydrolase n=1 Tax=Frondihabitans australicus TaxID=386892 RepID=A0A495IHC6_9MICO|nr:carbon-nitrogen hydrolase family protein [Frondihabitans australicus]RKR74721.1 putative amidohydrolase [Frondihabitans australicus]